MKIGIQVPASIEFEIPSPVKRAVRKLNKDDAAELLYSILRNHSGIPDWVRPSITFTICSQLVGAIQKEAFDDEEIQAAFPPARKPAAFDPIQAVKERYPE